MKMTRGLRAECAKKPRMEKVRCAIRMMHEEKGCAEELNRMTLVFEQSLVNRTKARASDFALSSYLVNDWSQYLRKCRYTVKVPL